MPQKSIENAHSGALPHLLNLVQNSVDYGTEKGKKEKNVPFSTLVAMDGANEAGGAERAQGRAWDGTTELVVSARARWRIAERERVSIEG